MAKNKGTTTETVSSVSVFTKEQFLKSNTYRQHKDLLSAVLDDTKTYSKEQVNSIINNFYRKVGK